MIPLRVFFVLGLLYRMERLGGLHRTLVIDSAPKSGTIG